MLVIHSSIDVLGQRNNWMRSLNLWSEFFSYRNKDLNCWLRKHYFFIIASYVHVHGVKVQKTKWIFLPLHVGHAGKIFPHTLQDPAVWLAFTDTVLARWSRIQSKKTGANSRLFFFVEALLPWFYTLRRSCTRMLTHEQQGGKQAFYEVKVRDIWGA